MAKTELSPIHPPSEMASELWEDGGGIQRFHLLLSALLTHILWTVASRVFLC